MNDNIANFFNKYFSPKKINSATPMNKHKGAILYFIIAMGFLYWFEKSRTLERNTYSIATIIRWEDYRYIYTFPFQGKTYTKTTPKHTYHEEGKRYWVWFDKTNIDNIRISLTLVNDSIVNVPWEGWRKPPIKEELNYNVSVPPN